MLDFVTQIILGIIQGVVEWLPFSSEGVLLLYQSNFIGPVDIEYFIRQALFLHFGTFFAALIYFRKDLKYLLYGAFNYKNADKETKSILAFLFVATIITGIIGIFILYILEFLNIHGAPKTSAGINFIVGFFLILSGSIQIRAARASYRRAANLRREDAILVGAAQGLAVIPGLSRSGITVSTLLFRNVHDTTALRLSFIMSLPVVLLGNILLNISDIVFMKEMFVGVLVAFIFGLGTIHLLMKFSERVKFGHFVMTFGILMILASALVMLI